MFWLIGFAMAQDVSGFAEARGIYQVGVDGNPVQVVGRVRPTFDMPLSDRVSLVTTVEAQLIWGRSLQSEIQSLMDDSVINEPDKIDGMSYFDAAECSWPEEPDNPFGLFSDSDMFNVDRLYLDIYQPKFDLRLGRQAVQWGSAQMINPTDPFPQVLFTEPWRFRQGVNAARFIVPWNDHEFQLFMGSNDTFSAARLAARGTLRAAGVDLSGVAAFRGETREALLGIDLRGTLGVGYWFEGAMHFPNGGDAWEEFAVGADYSFPIFEQFIFGAQYYRNGSGVEEGDFRAMAARLGDITLPYCEADDVNLVESLGFDDGEEEENPYAPFTTGRDYGLVFLRSMFTPEVGFQFAALQNFGDGTGIAIPQVTTYPTEWAELSFVAQVPYRAFGDGGEFKPADEDLRFVGQIDPRIRERLELDFNKVVPEVTFTLWMRANF